MSLLTKIKIRPEFMDRMVEDVNNISSPFEFIEFAQKMTLGNHFPFNPPDPLRSILRSKLDEIRSADETGILDHYADILKREYAPSQIPPGAVY